MSVKEKLRLHNMILYKMNLNFIRAPLYDHITIATSLLLEFNFPTFHNILWMF